MDSYLPMWTALHLGDALLCVLWTGMTVHALRDRAWVDAVVLGALTALGASWLGHELYTIAIGGLLSDTAMPATVASAGWIGLTAIVGVRQSVSGRGWGSLAPFLLAFQGPPSILFAFVASGRGVLERAAPARSWMGAVVLLLLLSAGLHHQRFAVRGAAGSAGFSTDEQVAVTEWLVDGAQLGAWAAAAVWAKRTRGA